MAGEVWKSIPPVRLALIKAAAWHCKQNSGRGVVNLYETWAALAQEVEVPFSKNQNHRLKPTDRLLCKRLKRTFPRIIEWQAAEVICFVSSF